MTITKHVLSVGLAMASVISVTVALPATAAAPITTELSGPVAGTSEVPAGTSTNRVFFERTLVFNYGGGSVTFSTCPGAACTWAIDDAARLTVTHPDGSQTSDYFESLTKDKPARTVTSLFMSGANSVRLELIDLMGPSAGLPRSLYLVESTGPLTVPVPGVLALPSGLASSFHPYSGFTTDPVNTRSGSFSYHHTDASIAGRGPVPEFSRWYDSSNTLVGDLGPGWTHDYAMRLVRPDATTPDIVLLGPQGRADRYVFAAGKYTPPGGIYAELSKASDGTFTVIDKDQGLLVFDETGRLLRLIDRFGAQSTLSYNSARQPVAVSDPAGRGALTFTYEPGGRLTGVADWTGRTTAYGYDPQGRLATFTDREGQVTRYQYEGTSQRLISITDALNHVMVTNTYDGQGKVSAQKDANGLTTGQQTSFGYVQNSDGSGVTTITYPKTSFEPSWNFVEIDTYDTLGRLMRRVTKPTSDSAGWITEDRTYDGTGNLSSVKDGRGNTTVFCYDVDYAGATIAASRGNMTRLIEPAPAAGANRPATLLKYDSKSNLIETISPRGVTSGTNVTCSTNLSGGINSLFAKNFSYDPDTQTLLLASTSRYTDPDQGAKTAVIRYEYGDPANPGQPTRVVPPRGNTGAAPDYGFATVFTYPASGPTAGTLARVTGPMGAVTTFDHDPVGRVAAMVEPRGNEAGASPANFRWEYVLDHEDRQRFVVAPSPVAGGDPIVVQHRFDAVGNETAQLDANGQVTRYLYDERDSLKEVHQSPNAWTDPTVNPAGLIVTEYQYDDLGNMTKISRAKADTPNERVAASLYDGLGRVRKTTEYPSWPATTPTLVSEFGYDTSGNRVSMKDPLLKTTAAAYDALNRVTSVTYNSSTTPNVTYSYDLDGNRIRMVDGTGTTNYSFDEAERLLTVQNPGPKTIGYRYDLDGNRRSLVYADGKAVSYAFDAADRLSGLTDWASRSTQYQYLTNGAVEQVSNFNGTKVLYAYDNAGRVLDVWNKLGANTIDRYSYEYDPAGNRLKMNAVTTGGEYDVTPITPARQGTVDYTYDRLYRLTREDRKLPFPQDKETLSYSYDPVGNRSSQTQLYYGVSRTTSFSYDRADRIQSATGDVQETYTLNENGNMTARGWTGGDKFSYDQANRMILSKRSPFSYRYSYDGDGKRTKVQDDSWWPTTYGTYIYDVNQAIPILIQDTTKQQKIVWGLGPLYVVDKDDNPGYYHLDALGSVHAITDYRGAGNDPRIQEYEEYRAFGSPGYSNRTYDQPFKFAGEMVDEGRTEYVNLRARDYDPAIGRFTSRDSVTGNFSQPQSLNRYSYVQNDPANLTDPSGHTPKYSVSSAPIPYPAPTPPYPPGLKPTSPFNVHGNLMIEGSCTAGPYVSVGPSLGCGASVGLPAHFVCGPSLIEVGVASCGISAMSVQVSAPIWSHTYFSVEDTIKERERNASRENSPGSHGR